MVPVVPHLSSSYGKLRNYKEYQSQSKAIMPDVNQYSSKYTRSVVTFDSNGTKCQGWFYLPKNDNKSNQKAPIVVMAHGFGLSRNHFLPIYAHNFALNGISVLLFDYRTFGDSEGVPRQLTQPKSQIQDYHNAIKYARNNLNNDVDVNRLGVFGTSFSGGHVMNVINEDTTIKCAISQGPFLGFTDEQLKFSNNVKLNTIVLLGVVGDKLRSIFGLPPIYLQIFGPPNEFCFLPSSDEKTWKNICAFWPQNDPNVGGKNGYPLRTQGDIVNYKPHEQIDINKIQSNTLLIICEKDTICDASLAHKLEKQKKNKDKLKVLSYNASHFDVYNELFDELLQHQIKFLKEEFNLV